MQMKNAKNNVPKNLLFSPLVRVCFVTILKKIPGLVLSAGYFESLLVTGSRFSATYDKELENKLETLLAVLVFEIKLESLLDEVFVSL